MYVRILRIYRSCHTYDSVASRIHTRHIQDRKKIETHNAMATRRKIDSHNAYTRDAYDNFLKKIALHNAMATTHNGSRLMMNLHTTTQSSKQNKAISTYFVMPFYICTHAFFHTFRVCKCVTQILSQVQKFATHVVSIQSCICIYTHTFFHENHVDRYSGIPMVYIPVCNSVLQCVATLSLQPRLDSLYQWCTYQWCISLLLHGR